MILYLGVLKSTPFFLCKTELISITKNITALSVAHIVTAICNFLSIALIARMLGPVLQGQWTLYISAFTLGTIALGFGLPPAINHFLAAGKIDKRLLVGQLFLFALTIGIIFVLGTYILSYTDLGSIILPSALSTQFIIIGLSCHFFLLMFNQLLASILLAERKFEVTSLITIAGAVLLLMGYVYFYFQNDASIILLKCFIFFNLIVLLVQCWLYLRSIIRLKGFSLELSFFTKPVLILLFSFAAWAYVTNFLQFLNYKIDVWFIEAYQQDDSQLGIYSIAVSLAQLIWLLPNAFHSIIFTDISEDAASIKYLRIKSWAVKIFALAIVLALIGYGLSFWLVPFFFGAAYQNVIQIFPYLLPGIVIFAPTILMSAYFAGINRVDINLKSTGFGFLGCILFNFLLIPSYGIIGAAIASTISYILSAVYLFVRFSRAKIKIH